MKKKVHTYQINLMPEEEGGYTVTVPSLPGCVTYGSTVDEAVEMAKEAIALHIETLKAHGLPLPDGESSRVLSTTVNVAV
jgi:antitoxin HicB